MVFWGLKIPFLQDSQSVANNLYNTKNECFYNEENVTRGKTLFTSQKKHRYNQNPYDKNPRNKEISKYIFQAKFFF